MPTLNNGWVGIDLDGTLAEYTDWQGIGHIGLPVPRMVEHVKYLREHGVEVRIFTARVQEGPVAVKIIEDWSLEHLGEVLPVTDRKDFSMVYALDDRIITVEANTGRMIAVPPTLDAIRKHWDVDNGAPDPKEFNHDSTV